MADRVLVTGGAGFIGYHLVLALLERGDAVTVVDDLSRGRLDAQMGALLDEVRFVTHDLTEPLPDDVGTGFRAVYHLAAVVGVRHASDAPARVLRTNLLSTLRVVDWSTRHQPDVVFLSSTSEVGDGAGRLGLSDFPLPESAPAAFAEPFLPRTSYAVSKLASELSVVHAATAAGVRARVARYHNVYGPRMGFDHVIPELTCRALEGHRPFPVYGVHQRRAFCHVHDAVRASLLLADLAGTEPIVANVGNDREETTIGALAQRILDAVGLDTDIEALDPPAGSPDRRLPHLGVLRASTGYEPRVSLADGLAETVAWYTATPMRVRG